MPPRSNTIGRTIGRVLLSLTMCFACYGMYIGAESASLPIVGTVPAFTRAFAVLGGLFFLFTVFYALFHRPSAVGDIGLESKHVPDAAEPVEKRFNHLLAKHGIRDGHIPTVLEVQMLVEDLNSPLSPMGAFAEAGVIAVFEDGQSPDDFWGPWTEVEDSSEYATLWVNRAPAEALPSLLALLDSSGPLRDGPENFENYGLPMLLGLWGKQRLHPWQEEMRTRLEQPESRLNALVVFAAETNVAIVPLLEHWSNSMKELSHLETELLIEAGVDLGRKGD